MEAQVNKEKYNFFRYTPIERWDTYWQQIKEVLLCEPKKMLEVGAGDKVLANYIKNNTQIDYQSLDIAKDLRPDIVGSVDAIPAADNSYDLACAFEVLEHLPYDKFQKSLKELKRVARKYVIISLPHWGRHFAFLLRAPGIRKVQAQIKFSLLPPEHKFDGEHYWEIGKKNYPLKKIKQDIEQSGFKIKKDYICPNSPYHHFFILNIQI